MLSEHPPTMDQMDTVSKTSAYDHTQHAPLWLIVEAAACYFFLAAWFVRTIPGLLATMCLVGVLMAALGLSFHHLTVRDRGEGLEVRFGPLPFFLTLLPYTDMRGVEVGRTMILESWGIHASPRGGWAWNLWGRECVIVSRKQGVFVIGTDDSANL